MENRSVFALKQETVNEFTDYIQWIIKKRSSKQKKKPTLFFLESTKKKIEREREKICLFQ